MRQPLPGTFRRPLPGDPPPGIRPHRGTSRGGTVPAPPARPHRRGPDRYPRGV